MAHGALAELAAIAGSKPPTGTHSKVRVKIMENQ
jgi:hypothetical protein